MSYIHSTYFTIASILSFETDVAELKTYIQKSLIDWEDVVRVASSHLIIPAIYIRLQSKGLLNSIPEDLVLYLGEINRLNLERNLQILEEVNTLSALLKTHNIDHVFLKGAAMLASGLYESLSERMVGDIDILIAQHQIDQAFHLLNTAGYTKHFDFDYEVKNYRHYPRQTSEHKLAAVELHTNVLKYNHRHLLDITDMLQTKEEINQINIPNNYFLNLHNILAWQINDDGYYYNHLSLKNSYDSLVLKLFNNKTLIESLAKTPVCAHYLALNKVLFPEYQLPPLKQHLERKQNDYRYAINHRNYLKTTYRLKQYYINIKHRVITFATNKSYRSHIFKNKLFKKK